VELHSKATLIRQIVYQLSKLCILTLRPRQSSRLTYMTVLSARENYAKTNKKISWRKCKRATAVHVIAKKSTAKNQR